MNKLSLFLSALIATTLLSSSVMGRAVNEGYMGDIETLTVLVTFIAAMGMVATASLAVKAFAGEVEKAMLTITYGFIGLALYEAKVITERVNVSIFEFLGEWENVLTHDLLVAVSFGAVAFGFYRIYRFASGGKQKTLQKET